MEVVTSEATWRRLANGSYSPVQAFLDGALRVRGDVALGKRVLRHLGEPGGTVDVC
jgi:putative sterol carrier protein